MLHGDHRLLKARLLDLFALRRLLRQLQLHLLMILFLLIFLLLFLLLWVSAVACAATVVSVRATVVPACRAMAFAVRARMVTTMAVLINIL